jgi:glutathionylspermidine synthase
MTSSSSVRVVRAGLGDPLASSEFQRELEQRWFVWDRCVAGKRRVEVHPLVLGEAAHEEAMRVAKEATALVFRAADHAAASAPERALYRFHPDVDQLAAAARAGRDRTALVRVDLLLRDDGHFVACEVNADCPGGYNETLALPRLARLAGFKQAARDPTTIAQRLADRLVALAGGPSSPRGVIGLVCATAYAEDLQICAIVEQLVRARGGRVMRMPATGPQASGRGVAFRGERIAVLYRFYPLEYMAEQRNITALADAVERGELRCVSSFDVIHAQSKLAMARAWAHEPMRANAVFPGTFALRDLEGASVLRDRAGWVVKRDLSRVGDHVIVGALETDEAFRAALDGIADAELEGEVWVAQRFVPPGYVPTPWGPRCLTLGVYVLDGVSLGYFARLTPTSHCSHDALVVPVFVGDAEPLTATAEVCA